MRNSLLSCLGFLSVPLAWAGIILDANVAQKLVVQQVCGPVVVVAPNRFGQGGILGRSTDNPNVANCNGLYGKGSLLGRIDQPRSPEANAFIRQHSAQMHIYRARSYRLAP